jgi:hypothetical protein
MIRKCTIVLDRVVNLLVVFKKQLVHGRKTMHEEVPLRGAVDKYLLR